VVLQILLDAAMKIKVFQHISKRPSDGKGKPIKIAQNDNMNPKL
jgi:hypothetical protein